MHVVLVSASFSNSGIQAIMPSFITLPLLLFISSQAIEARPTQGGHTTRDRDVKKTVEFVGVLMYTLTGLF